VMLDDMNTVPLDIKIYVVAVDNITVREALWKSVKMKGRGHWIDPRMGGDGWSLYVADLANFNDHKWYEAMLHPASESAELPCGQRGLLCVPAMLASVTADQIRKITMSLPYSPKLSYSSVGNVMLEV